MYGIGICGRRRLVSFHLRRIRIKTDAKAKVVASIWGAKFVQFLAALAVLPRVDLEETVEFILFMSLSIRLLWFSP